MKKIILIIATFVITLAAYGQNGRNYLGAGISFGTDIETVGIGIKYGYGITNRLYIEPNFNYFIKNNTNMYDINVDLQYRFYVVDRLSVYPIVGLSFAHVKYTYKDEYWHLEWKNNKMGGNFGGGVAYDITHHLFVNLDMKYRAMQHIGQGVFHIGVGYRF